MAYSIAFVVSPAISTAMIASGLAAAWIAALCAGCIGTVLLGRRLRRQLHEREDRVQPDAVPEDAEPALP